MLAVAFGFVLWQIARIPANLPYQVGPPVASGTVEPTLTLNWGNGLMIAPDATLWTWGGHSPWQASLTPETGTSPVPVQVGTDRDWSRAAAGLAFALAIKTNGTLWGWGGNYSGQLPTNYPNPIPNIVQIGPETDWQDVSVGAAHVMALKRDRTLWLWGQNDVGQAGNGTRSNVFNPFQITTNLHWQSISAGAFNSYAIDAGGRLWGWGLSVAGAIAGQAGHDFSPSLLDSGTNWASISAGDFHLIAVKRDGTLWLRGQNAAGILSSQATLPTNLVHLGTETGWSRAWSGQNSFIARKADGTWWQSLNGPRMKSFGDVDEVGEELYLHQFATDFEPWAMATDGYTTVVLHKDGRLWSIGKQTGAPTQTPVWKRLGNKLAEVFNRGGPPGRGPAFPPEPPTDRSPRLIWEYQPLPAQKPD